MGAASGKGFIRLVAAVVVVSVAPGALACDRVATPQASHGTAQLTDRRVVPAAANQRLKPVEALEAINRVRAEAGLAPLSLDASLTRAAYAHAEELARRDDISHYGVNGSTPVTRVAATGYSAVTTGENLAIGQRRFEDVLDMWLASPSPRETLMQGSVKHAGRALVEDASTTYRTFWAMVVAEPF